MKAASSRTVFGLAQGSGPLIDGPHGHTGGGIVGKRSGSGCSDNGLVHLKEE